MVWIIVGVVVLLLLLFYIVSTYNNLVGLKNKVHDQFSQIDVQLKQRFDLIPNLVETVKGYTKHETETFEKVVNARNSYMNASTDAEKVEASNSLTAGISRLFALAEDYPELKANTNFMDLQAQLKEIEEKISYARQFYNDAVLMYNNKVEMFPSNLVALIFRFKSGSFFEANDNERENVKVKF